MEIGIYFLSVIYLHIINCEQWFKKHTMHKPLKINCFLISNAGTTLLLIPLTIPDCSVLHLFSHPCAAALSLLCQESGAQVTLSHWGCASPCTVVMFCCGCGTSCLHGSSQELGFLWLKRVDNISVFLLLLLLNWAHTGTRLSTCLLPPLLPKQWARHWQWQLAPAEQWDFPAHMMSCSVIKAQDKEV